MVQRTPIGDWCDSVRRGGKVVQETVSQLGELDAHGRASAALLAQQMMGAGQQRELFEADTQPERSVAVRLDGVSIERARAFGGVWLDGQYGARCVWTGYVRSYFQWVAKRSRGRRWRRYWLSPRLEVWKLVTMKPTRGKSSPKWNSTFATTRRALVQLAA